MSKLLFCSQKMSDSLKKLMSEFPTCKWIQKYKMGKDLKFEPRILKSASSACYLQAIFQTLNTFRLLKSKLWLGLNNNNNMQNRLLSLHPSCFKSADCVDIVKFLYSPVVGRNIKVLFEATRTCWPYWRLSPPEGWYCLTVQSWMIPTLLVPLSLLQGVLAILKKAAMSIGELASL